MDDKLLAAPEVDSPGAFSVLSVIWNFYGLSWLTPIFTLILLAVLAFLVWHFFFPSKAEWAEGKVVKLAVLEKLRAFAGEDGYQCRHNLPLIGGGVRKVKTDFVLFSPYGIFVIDAKRFGGLIIGGEKDDRWRRAGGKAFKRRLFPNPLRKSRNNAEVMQKLTGLPKYCFHPLVVVADDTVFQSPMPHNIIWLQKLQDYVAARKKIVLSPDEIGDAIAAVAAGKQKIAPDAAANLRRYVQDAAEKTREYVRRLGR